MISRAKLMLAGAGGLIILTTGAAVVFKLNGEPDRPAAVAARQIDSLAATSSSSDLAIPVESDAVIRDTLVLAVSAAGQAAPWREAVITARVAGQVQSVARAENAAVGAGASLATIDPAEYELALKEAQARHRTAEATYREMTLFDERITDAAVRAERQKAARAKSGLEQAEVAVQKAQLELERARVRAPFAGRVANLTVQAGQYVRPGDELLTIIDLQRIRVEVQVLERQVGFLTPGRKARVHFAAFPEKEFDGRIETINPIVDEETRSARVVVSVTNAHGRILPGMYARVLLDARRFADRVIVPRAAILERDRRKMLFVFEPAEAGSTRGLAKWRYVTTGLENETQVEIVESSETELVAPGEIVLVGGHQTLVHDARVRVTEKSDTASNSRPRLP
ncbi:MAG: efflux RND transporter periplasmic adaptor subunit [Gemmatimonadota bacterium]